MDELTDPQTLEHTISRVQIVDVTITVGATTVLPATPATKVTVTGPEMTHIPHNVSFTVQNTGGGDILVTAQEALVKPKPHVYKTGKKAMITTVVVNGTVHSISGSGAVVVTVTYA